jgi:hypothetical protein
MYYQEWNCRALWRALRYTKLSLAVHHAVGVCVAGVRGAGLRGCGPSEGKHIARFLMLFGMFLRFQTRLQSS